MNINIKEKIEQINKQPEYVRRRYMWGCLTFSMIIIVIFWFFSIFSTFKNNIVATPTNNQAVTNLNDQINAIKEQAAGLKEGINDQSIESLKETSSENQQNTSNSINSSSLENSASKIPESSSYSKLPKPNTDTSIQQ
jgi:predicted PurR-regulated permease PerM